MTTTAPTSTTRHAMLELPLGPLTIVGDDHGIAGLYFPGHWTRPDRSAFGPRVGVDAIFGRAGEQLAEYFGGRRQTFDLPLTQPHDEIGQVLRRALDTIPYGQTTTYGTLAKEIGRGLTPREIGTLVGRNPLSILVPCHRVVGAGGKLTGYAGGLARKKHLLDLEQSVVRTAPSPSAPALGSATNPSSAERGETIR